MHSKASGLLILLAVVTAPLHAGQFPVLSGYSFEPGPGYVKTAGGFGIADTWLVESLIQKNWVIQSTVFRLGAGCSYQSLGEFLFPDSEGAAVRAVSTSSGFVLGASLFTGITLGQISAGLVEALQYEAISGIDYVRYDYQTVLMLQWKPPAFELELAGSYRNGLFNLSTALYWWMNISRIHMKGGAGLEYYQGPIVKGCLELNSWEKDFKLGVVLRYGLQYEVYEAFTVYLSRFIRDWEYSIEFAPSFIENNRVRLEIKYILQDETGAADRFD